MEKLGLANKLKAINLNTDEILGINKLKNKDNEKIQDVPLSKIRDFKNHPFKVCDGEPLTNLVESIKIYGVLNPAIVRIIEPDENGCEYEMISGHRRKKASNIADKETIPCIIKDIDDDRATIIMVDSNLQRENILPSEKAFAYKMKLDAMNRQGKRTDLTLSQVGTRKENSLTLSQVGTKKENSLTLSQVGTKKENSLTLSQLGTQKRSDQILAEQIGESRNQIQRYIRLTYLIPSILKMVDEKQIAFIPAVELSYIDEQEQHILEMLLKENKYKIDQNKAVLLKQNSGNLNIELINKILLGDKEIRQKPIKIKQQIIKRYFKPEQDPEEVEDIIEKALDNYFSILNKE